MASDLFPIESDLHTRSGETYPWPMQLLMTQSLLPHNPSALQSKVNMQSIPVFLLATSDHPGLLCLCLFAGQFVSLGYSMQVLEF